MEEVVGYGRDENGKFKPGHGGRPKGAKNKFTREVKERIEDILERLDDFLGNDLEKMKPADRVRLWADLQEYIRPKLQRMNMEIEPGEKAITQITFKVERGDE